MAAAVEIPDDLAWWREVPGGGAWLDRLPRLVTACAEQWGLRLGTPFADVAVSYVTPATRADGIEVVLKVVFPEPESEHEGDALALWDGDGAVRLLAADRERQALLLERVRPGDTLWSLPDEEAANAAAAALMQRLWRAPPADHAYRTLAGEAAQWAVEIPTRWEALGRPFERRLVDLAVAAIRELVPSQERLVVVHQDLHGGNVLRATREPWVVIDPKPLVGEPAFDVASLLRDRRDELAREPHAARRVARRLDQLSDLLALDRERLRGWAIAHALAWGMTDDEVVGEMVASARWLAEA